MLAAAVEEATCHLKSPPEVPGDARGLPDKTATSYMLGEASDTEYSPISIDMCAATETYPCGKQFHVSSDHALSCPFLMPAKLLYQNQKVAWPVLSRVRLEGEKSSAGLMR